MSFLPSSAWIFQIMFIFPLLHCAVSQMLISDINFSGLSPLKPLVHHEFPFSFLFVISFYSRLFQDSVFCLYLTYFSATYIQTFKKYNIPYQKFFLQDSCKGQ